MNKHQGQLVEYLIRRNGYSLSDLAKELRVNRRTLYNWFKSENLRSDIIYKIGQVIRHDFSNDFPELFTKSEFAIKSKVLTESDDSIFKEKYIRLLEKYNEILLKETFFSVLAFLMPVLAYSTDVI